MNANNRHRMMTENEAKKIHSNRNKFVFGCFLLTTISTFLFFMVAEPFKGYIIIACVVALVLLAGYTEPAKTIYYCPWGYHDWSYEIARYGSAKNEVILKKTCLFCGKTEEEKAIMIGLCEPDSYYQKCFLDE